MKYYAATDVGKVRKQNEDSVYACDERIGCLPNLFLVADGMGGEKGGEVASSLAIEKILASVKSNGRVDPAQIILSAIKTANIAVHHRATEDNTLSGMGTTIVAASIVGSSLFVFNVGDSRLYLIRDGLKQITKDHSLVEELVKAGKLSRDSEEYINNKNIITKAIGSSDNVEPDFFRIDLLPGDRILLCSDGVTNTVTDEKIAAILSTQADLKDLVESLIKTGIDNGGVDNLTAILVDPEISEVDTWC
ncbi:MAG: Stp1/IreP family PP2C-type Ser/Thr phosphatase [Lachnospiraceae bacterium]|nr:Stp1/IreP family PP2C-type Ser/Thr phosphatase [Candidatus Minthocola equi]